MNIGTLVLTQWNHHWLDYLRPTGLFCLVSKQCFPPHTVENTNTYLNPDTDEYRNTSFDTVEPSLARLPQAHRIILPCVKTLFLQTLLRIRTHIFIHAVLNIGTLVLTQWNHHRLDYLRPTGLFCLVSKQCFPPHTVENTNAYLHPCTVEYRNTCFDTVEPSLARLPPTHRIILPCVKTLCFPPHTLFRIQTHIFIHALLNIGTLVLTVEPSLARLPQAHRIILPCVKTLFSPNTVENTNTYLHPHTVEYRNTCFDTVEPSSARLPQVHMIILPCVKRVLSSTHC